jgi:hypothetical protein
VGAPAISNGITGCATGGDCGVPDKRAIAMILVMLNFGTFRSKPLANNILKAGSQADNCLSRIAFHPKSGVISDDS